MLVVYGQNIVVSEEPSMVCWSEVQDPASWTPKHEPVRVAPPYQLGSVTVTFRYDV